MRSTRFFRNIGIYFLGIFSSKLLQFLFIPLYTKYVSSSDFGYFSLVLSSMSLAVPLLYQSVWEGLLRFAIEREGEERKVLSTTSMYCVSLTLIYSVLFVFFSAMFQLEYSMAILIMGISQVGASYWLFSARALKQNKIYAISTVVSSVVTITLNVILIMGFKMGLVGLFVANIAGNFALIIVLEANMGILWSMKKLDFDQALLCAILKYSLPLSINAASWWLITSSNNFVISSQIGIGANGIYAVASRFGGIMTLVTSVVNMAWLEEAFRSHGDNDRDDYFNNVFAVLSRVILSGVALLIPLTYIFYQIFVFGDYRSGMVLTPLVYLSAAYATLATHLGSGFLARKESGVIFKTTLLGGVLSLIAAFVVAKPLGLLGVVGTSVLGYMIMYSVRIPLLQKRMTLRVNHLEIFGITLMCVLIMFVCQLGQDSLKYQVAVFALVGVIVTVINQGLIRIVFGQLREKVVRHKSNG